MTISDIWTDEDPKEFNLQDLSGRFYPESLDARKWRWVFIDGFRKNNIDEKLSQWKSRADKCDPFFRTDISYITPSCRELRIKVPNIDKWVTTRDVINYN